MAALKAGKSAATQLSRDGAGFFVSRGSAIFDVYAADRIEQPVAVGNN